MNTPETGSGFKNSLSNSISVLMYNLWKLQQFFLYFCFFFPIFFLNDLSINSHFPEEKWTMWAGRKEKTKSKTKWVVNLKKEKRARDGGRRQINCLTFIFCSGVFEHECVDVCMVCTCKCYVNVGGCCSVNGWDYTCCLGTSSSSDQWRRSCSHWFPSTLAEHNQAASVWEWKRQEWDQVIQ